MYKIEYVLSLGLPNSTHTYFPGGPGKRRLRAGGLYGYKVHAIGYRNVRLTKTIGWHYERD